MSSINERIEKCYSDNVLLVDSLPIDVDNPLERSYIVMGNSGIPYQVTISNYPKCTCPDNQNQGRRCKHIFFILLRIMNITDTRRRKFSDNDLITMYMNSPPITKDLIYQGKKPRLRERVVEQKFEEGDTCPICLESLENGKELDYCKYSCGKTIHKQCFKMWALSKGKICVYCRSKWYADGEEFYHKTISYHPIKKNENNINEDKNQINNNETNNGNEINNGEENIDEINEKINLILKNDCKCKIKIKKKRGRRKREGGTKNREKSLEEEIEGNRERSRSRSRSRNKENTNI